MVCFAIGADTPLNTGAQFDNIFGEQSFPLGISLHAISFYTYISLKSNMGWDFVQYSERATVLFGGTFSLGFSPIHNDYCFIGFYGTMGLEEIDNYSYTSYGISAIGSFNFSDRFGIFVNCDALCRLKGVYKGDEEIPPYEPLFLNTWRIYPSIGIIYTFIRSL